MKTLLRIKPFPFLLILLGVIVVVSSLGPPESILGSNVRLVYIHGAWVWTALFAFGVSAGTGGLGLVTKNSRLHSWSAALGQTGLFFWITSLPLSLWTTEANWNGLYLAEPRWRMAIDFAIAGGLVQIALLVLRRPSWGSAINLLYFVALFAALIQTEQVMHPPSPIFTSGSTLIQSFFLGLVSLCLLAGWQLSRWFRSLAPMREN